MTTNTPPVDSDVIATASAITTSSKDTTRVSVPIPPPCITILVHGVNDVGEAYLAQETGICHGLNARLNRAHDLKPGSLADLNPATYKTPPETAEEKKEEGILKDPDAVYYRRTPVAATWSPVVPFYWGFSEEESEINKHEVHGQWTDRYGNRLDQNGCKNGGPFANATSDLNAMWGDGFNGKVLHLESGARIASGPLHNLKKACPRHYQLLAAKRLAMLVKMIRNNPVYKEAAINIVCHSQGSMVTLAAHALLEAEGANLAADTLIFQDPPYSLEETFFEHEDGTTGNDQQTTQSRIKTLSNIVKYVGQAKATTPPLASLPVDRDGNGVVGQFWQPGAGAQQRVRKKEYTFTERDNRGKVYLYFCPHDQTVSLMNIQGIGWSGVPDSVEALDGKMVQVHEGRATVLRPGKVAVPAFPALDPAVFRQRVFTERTVNDAPMLVGAPPTNYELRSTKGVSFIGSEAASTGGLSNKSIAKGATRHINGEELNPTVKPDLRTGEAGHQGQLAVNPIDAAIAVTFEGKGGIKRTSDTLPDARTAHQDQPLTAVEIRALEDRLPGQRADAVDNDDRLRVVSAHPINNGESPGMLHVVYTTETAKEVRTRWQNETDDNSYHSAIPANPDHAEGVTAYDLSLGKPLPLSQEDRAYMDYLRAVADWRTDWDKMENATDNPSAQRTMEFKAKEAMKDAVKLVNATFVYRGKGTLPAEIAVNGVVKLDIPKLIVTQTLVDRSRGLEPRAHAPRPK